MPGDGIHVLHVVGARPNFMKAAPVLHALAAKAGVTQMLVHTGQHYDASLSDVFFSQLRIPEPDVNLQVGSGSHAWQTGQIMIRFERVLSARKPDWVLVYGDVNSTAAAALVCAKLYVRVAHVEAGLRSFDRRMPEEINRVITDQVADLLFTPSQDGNDNLQKEGIPPKRIRLVGNVMIDSLVRLLPEAARCPPGDPPACYAVVTLHRPSNVDEPEMLARIVELLQWLAHQIDVFFPVHPRTRKRLEEFGLALNAPRLRLLDPLPYLEFLGLQQRATVVLTDSGGIQEETTFLGIPCLTLRENTERPITVAVGTNILVGQNMALARTELQKIIEGRPKCGAVPPLWDGHTSERIAEILTS